MSPTDTILGTHAISVREKQLRCPDTNHINIQKQEQGNDSTLSALAIQPEPQIL